MLLFQLKITLVFARNSRIIAQTVTLLYAGLHCAIVCKFGYWLKAKFRGRLVRGRSSFLQLWDWRWGVVLFAAQFIRGNIRYTVSDGIVM